MQHSLRPNPDPARMLCASVGKSDTAEAGAPLRKYHWKHNIFFFSQEQRMPQKNQYINMTFSPVWLFNTFIHFLRSWPLVQEAQGLIQSPSLLIEGFFPLTSMDLGPSPRKTRFHSSKSDTHSPHSKKNNTRHLRCQSA